MINLGDYNWLRKTPIWLWKWKWMFTFRFPFWVKNKMPIDTQTAVQYSSVRAMGVTRWRQLFRRPSIQDLRWSMQMYHITTAGKLSWSFLGCIARSQRMRCGLLLQMSHIAWSVCLCVCWAHRWAVKKTAEQIDMPFAGITHVRPRNYPGNIEMGSRTSTVRGTLEEGTSAGPL